MRLPLAIAPSIFTCVGIYLNPGACSSRSWVTHHHHGSATQHRVGPAGRRWLGRRARPASREHMPIFLLAWAFAGPGIAAPWASFFFLFLFFFSAGGSTVPGPATIDGKWWRLKDQGLFRYSRARKREVPIPGVHAPPVKRKEVICPASGPDREKMLGWAGDLGLHPVSVAPSGLARRNGSC